MNHTNGNSNSFYSYLIRPDKSATPQLDELCHGLAKVIVTEIDPGSNTELTPHRLAAFYRHVGGNYDSVFLEPSPHGLSFMYKTLGCFHSLQPTNSPFEDPNIPCLTPTGFARWQTLQLLLCPEDSVSFLQRAVDKWNVPRADGGVFPKHVPTSCFPDKADEAMERWYKYVTGSLNQENYMRRLKNSPHQSPYPLPQDRRDGYFANGQAGPPPRATRNNSHDEGQARLGVYRRRSSVPDVVPLPIPLDNRSHWDSKSRERKGRSQSAQRPVKPPSRQRSYTHTSSTSAHGNPRHSNSPVTHRHSGHAADHQHSRPSSQQQHPYTYHSHRSSGRRSKSPCTPDGGTGSEGSSEGGRRHRRSDEDQSRRRSSLWPPSFFKSHKRRHSSDAGTRQIEAQPPQPLRPEYYPARPAQQQPPVPVPHPSYRPASGVRFRDDIFDTPQPQHTNTSAPDLPAQQPFPKQQGPDLRAPPVIRYPDPPSAYPSHQMDGLSIGQPLTRESSGSGSGNEHRHHNEFYDRGAQRKAGAPMRVSTVTGVGGRKYASQEPTSAAERQHAKVRGSLPQPVGT